MKDEYKMEENKVDASKEFGEKLYEIRFKLENCIIPNEKVFFLLFYKQNFLIIKVLYLYNILIIIYAFNRTVKC